MTLIIETSTEKACLVLAEGPLPIDVLFLPGGPQLSKRLGEEVSCFLEKHSVRPSKIAVGKGPGSFTGVRVGMALAKALAFGWQIPLVSLCSLSSFMPDASPFAILVDARIGGIHVLRETGIPILAQPDTLIHALENVPLFSPHPDLIQKRLPFPCQEASPLPHRLAQLANKL